MKIAKKIVVVFIVLVAIALIVVFKTNSISANTMNRYIKSFQEYSGKVSAANVSIVIDYTMPIYKKRLWVIDTKNNNVLLNCHVSHALNSGILYVNDLSNEVGSNKSCAGAFVCGEKYTGKYGRSMRIDGLEQGINHNARSRSIVFHPTTKFKIKGITIPVTYAYYSLGCFAVSDENMVKIIDIVPQGSFIYVNHN